MHLGELKAPVFLHQLLKLVNLHLLTGCHSLDAHSIRPLHLLLFLDQTVWLTARFLDLPGVGCSSRSTDPWRGYRCKLTVWGRRQDHWRKFVLGDGVPGAVLGRW